MRTHESTRAPTRAATRTLDEQVARRLLGYRWVEWNHRRLGGAPIDEPGSFLAAPDDPLDHLYIPARPGARPCAAAFSRVPRFSECLDPAFAAAEAAGLFTNGAAVYRSTAGDWVVEIPSDGRRFEGSQLAMLLCRAALEASAPKSQTPIT